VILWNTKYPERGQGVARLATGIRIVAGLAKIPRIRLEIA
jgi:hypothetical protein